jgi:5-methylcytosine-specific restriction endonuclease McrA
MPIERLCKYCHKKMLAYTTLQNKCADCVVKNTKTIPKQGKVTKLYNKWRDLIAIPYLDQRFGRACAKCGTMPPMNDDGSYGRYEVDHIKNRSTHPELRMDVKNVQYLCTNCHREKTGTIKWTKKETA